MKKRRRNRRYCRKPPFAADIFLPFIAELDIFESFEINLILKNKRFFVFR